MELIYAWIEKFRNYKDVELLFSDVFNIHFDKAKKSIKITPNKMHMKIYPDYITNINAIVGKNGVGKTNLLDLLGLRRSDRYKNDAEFEIKYKRKTGPYRIPNDVEAVIKHSIYFFIYYMGKDDHGEDLFCFEGNDIDSFQSIIKFSFSPDIKYWRSKYWFAFICNYSGGMLIHKCDLNAKREKDQKDNISNFKDYVSEQDKSVIISFREIFNKQYYDSRSTEPRDDYTISVPRRNAYFQSNLLSMKIQMLYAQLQNPKRLMFQNDKYSLKITYNSFFLTDDMDDEDKLIMPFSYNDLSGKDKEVCKVLESYVQYFYNDFNNAGNNKIKVNKENLLSNITIKRKSLEEYQKYYIEIMERIANHYIEDKQAIQHILNCYKDLAEKLSRNQNLQFGQDDMNDYISINITKQANIKEILKIIDVTIDEKVKSRILDMFTVFGNFFDYSIGNLSDGETAYLGFFASLYEQVSLLTSNKEKYIILLDEPEARMHPELTRNFISELVLFLKDLSKDQKKFQIIISTHSPFILSDIQSNNIIYLEKDSTGYCTPVKRKLNTFGANIHTLLKDGFFMSSTMGEFATNKIKEIIASIIDKNSEDVTEEQKNEWLHIIHSIGEPLIQNRLLRMFNDKFVLNYTDLYYENVKLKNKLKIYEDPRRISDTIEVLRKQIEKLQIHVNELEAKQNDKD